VPATASVAEIAHWRLKGGDIGGEIRRPRRGKAELDPMHLAGEAEAGLRRLLQYFDGPGATYAAVPDPRFQPRYNDYEHLERVLEWSGGGGE
jgi:ATP-dependent helicase/nuclease subunit B